MNSELTKAAQQALEALRANAIHYGDPLRCSRDAIAALERAHGITAPAGGEGPTQ